MIHSWMQRAWLAALGMALLPAAQAVQYGVVPGTSPSSPSVVNPFNNQSTDAWKLVGVLGCSAVQISREWVASAVHCSIAQDGSVFRSVMGQSTVSGCTQVGPDMFICRLDTPAALVQPTSFPPLAVAPNATELLPGSSGIFGGAGAFPSRAAAAKYGSLMVYGHSPAADGLVFVGFNGLPFGYDPILAPATPPVPYTVGGDSGGAAYWFAPNGHAPALVGLLTSAATADRSPTYFTNGQLDNIRDTISGKGDPVPTLLYAGQNFTDPTGMPAPELAQAPSATYAAATGITLSWTTPPAASPAVSSYDVSLGKDGALDRTQSVAAGGANKVSFNNLETKKYVACVRPRNSIGPSNAAYPTYMVPTNAPWYVAIQAPNCTTIDNRVNQAVVTGLSGSSQASAGAYNVTFTWPASASNPSDLAITGYRIQQSVGYPGGPQRTTTTDIAATRRVVAVTQGTRVCLSVAAVTAMGQVGATSAAVCVTAN